MLGFRRASVGEVPGREFLQLRAQRESGQPGVQREAEPRREETGARGVLRVPVFPREFRYQRVRSDRQVRRSLT